MSELEDVVLLSSPVGWGLPKPPPVELGEPCSIEVGP